MRKYGLLTTIADELSRNRWFAATPSGVSHVIGRRLYGGNVRGTAEAA